MISALIPTRRVAAMDVAWLRREVFAGGEVSREAAEELFAVARSTIVKAPEWTAFFVEMITDHTVWQARPTGVVNEGQAEWLIAQADAGPNIDGMAALVNILAEAHRTPAWFLAAVRSRAARGWPGLDAGLAAAL